MGTVLWLQTGQAGEPSPWFRAGEPSPWFPLLLSSASAVVLADLLHGLAGIEVGVHLGGAGGPAGAGDGLGDGAEVLFGSLAVVDVVGGAAGGDAEAGGLADGVDVGAEEDELPAVSLLLALDHVADLVEAVAAAGVLHAISDDDENGLLRDILLACVFVDVADVVDGATDGVEQGGAAADVVLGIRHGLDLVDLHAVVEDFGPVVEEQDRGQDLALFVFFFLSVDHAVEAADGVGLQAAHGTAAVQDQYKLSQILSHGNTSSFCVSNVYRQVCVKSFLNF